MPRILNILSMARFLICEHYLSLSEYAFKYVYWLSSEHISDSKYAMILNMAEFWICQL